MGSAMNPRYFMAEGREKLESNLHLPRWMIFLCVTQTLFRFEWDFKLRLDFESMMNFSFLFSFRNSKHSSVCDRTEENLRICVIDRPSPQPSLLRQPRLLEPNISNVDHIVKRGIEEKKKKLRSIYIIFMNTERWMVNVQLYSESKSNTPHTNDVND